MMLVLILKFAYMLSNVLFSVGYELNFWSGVYGTVIGKLHLASPNKSETRLLWLFVCVKSVNIAVSDTHC